jgi:preprotein translocase subunit SecE
MATSPTGNQGGNDPKGSLPLPSSRRGIKGFYNEVVREMKRVSWPTKAETHRLTGVVLTTCVALVVLLSAMGYIFDTVIRLITTGKV